MFCSNCGSPSNEMIFCSNCGTKQNTKTASDFQSKKIEVKTHVDQLKSFFRNDIYGIILLIFKKPITGIFNVLNKSRDEAFRQALILILTASFLFIFLPYIFAGSARDYIGLNSFIVLGFGVLITLVIISFLTFLVKSLTISPDFKKELLTGGLCAIPLTFLLIIIVLLSLFSSSWNLYSFSFQNILQAGFLLICVILYVVMMLINIVQQSLLASDSNESLSWWISPFLVLISVYIGYKVSIGLLS